MQTAYNTHLLKNYLIGFVLALILTAIPFGVVWSGELPAEIALVIVAVSAIIQVIVHLIFFLHLDFKSTPVENLLALAFAALLIFVMVGGSLWIMFNLHERMM